MVDEQTFLSEVQDMERMLYRVSRGYLPAWVDPGDAVQSALEKAWKKRATADPAYFRAWLMRILINECRSIMRWRRREIPTDSFREEAAEPPDPLLRDLLFALPAYLRMPLLMHDLEGFSIAEIARILRIPQGTVKSRMYQARKRLKEEWEASNRES